MAQWGKNIQAAAYNGAHTVYTKEVNFYSLMLFIQISFSSSAELLENESAIDNK